MQASPLEIRDLRRPKGKRFDLPTVLLCAILSMVAGPIRIGRCTSSFVITLAERRL